MNDERATRGDTIRLAKGSGYFYFHFSEAAGCLDRTVRVRKFCGLTLKQWIAEFGRLKDLDQLIMKTVRPKQA